MKTQLDAGFSPVVDNGSVDWTLEGLQRVLNVPRPLSVPSVLKVPEPKKAVKR